MSQNMYAKPVGKVKMAQHAKRSGSACHFPNHCHERTSGMSTFNSIEIWKPVIGFDGNYEVSDLGRVRSLERITKIPNGWRTFPSKVLKPIFAGTGYLVANLCVNGKKKQKHIHAMVLDAFVGPSPYGNQACHKNGIRSDARLDNLRWDTIKNNHADKMGHGTHLFGEAHGNAKLTNSQAAEIKYSIESRAAIASRFGISASTVKKIRIGKAWPHV
jgi:hypothetical protein